MTVHEDNPPLTPPDSAPTREQMLSILRSLGVKGCEEWPTEQEGDVSKPTFGPALESQGDDAEP